MNRSLLSLLLFILAFLAWGPIVRGASPGAEVPVRPDPPRIKAAPPAQTVLTMDCDPCSFKIAQGLTPYSIRFVIRNLRQDMRVIKALRVSRDDKPGWAQALRVHGMEPVSENKEFAIGTQDVNFDGYNDLLLATVRGAANTRAAYWRFVPAKQEFAYLGNYPIFKVDPDKRLLSTYERGGHAGMVYKANEYRWIKGTLTLVRSEQQAATKEKGVYVKKVFKRERGKLRLIAKEIITEPRPEEKPETP